MGEGQPTDTCSKCVSSSLCIPLNFLFVLLFALLDMFGPLDIPFNPIFNFLTCELIGGNRHQRDLFQMRRYKLPVLLVGEEKALYTKRMRWILYHLTSIFYDYFHSISSLQHCILQVFLDIVESVNLLMSSKGEL